MFEYEKFFAGDIVKVNSLMSGSTIKNDLYLVIKPISQCGDILLCLKDGKEVTLDTRTYFLDCKKLNT